MSPREIHTDWDMTSLTLPQAPCVHVWVAHAPGRDSDAPRPPSAAQRRQVDCALLTRALERHWGIERHQWRLTHTTAGAPKLELSDAGPSLRCSFSHADGATLCAVGPAAALGVDLERLRRDDRQERLARLVCSEQELAQLVACRRPSLRSARFLGLWTLKEASAKAIDAGALATVSLRRLSFDMARHASLAAGAEAALPAALPATPWRFHRFAVGMRHVAAIAWRDASQ